jgi:hypothetical protein
LSMKSAFVTRTPSCFPDRSVDRSDASERESA